MHRKVIWTGDSISELHRWGMFSDDKSCCAGLAELKKKRSQIFSKSFVEFTKNPPTGSKKMLGYVRSVLNAAIRRICLIKAWPMKLHLFSTFCYDMDCEHDGLPHILI